MNFSKVVDRFLKGVTNFLDAGVKFVKSSILSIIILAIMFFLLANVEQGASLVIDLMEGDLSAFLGAFFLINILAFSLSHYPIYNYYAANLNKSKNVFEWEPKKVLGFIRVTIFKPDFKEPYHFNIWANVFRYLNGVLVFVIWGCILVYGFEQNLMFDEGSPKGWYWAVCLTAAVALIGYGWIRNEKFKFKESLIAIELDKEPKVKDAKSRNDRMNYRLSWLFFLTTLVFGICMIILIYLISNHLGFSRLGLLLSLIANFCLVLLYFTFRLLRQELKSVVEYLKEEKKSKLLRWFIKIFQFAQKPHEYLTILIVTFFGSVIYLICIHFLTVNGADIGNGIPILFAYLYAYSFILFSIFKYFFVTRKSLEPQYKKGTFKAKRLRKWRWILGISSAVLLLLIWIGSMNGTETVIHELSIVDEEQEEYLTEYDLVRDVAAKEDTVFFIAAQGGGLKGNFWTLYVLNKLQTITNGRLLENTVAMSGASGGSLGLGLYTALFREHGIDTVAIQEKVETISNGNYTSIDLSLMFGKDFLRKVYPFNVFGGNENRAYHKMLRYENMIGGTENSILSTQGFRSLWMDAYAKGNGAFPSLIMNTSSVRGRRGIFWSHKPDRAFMRIFPNAENLLELEEGKTIPFYEAVSTTNRFPLLSPAAKIKGKGHFIDAGAIDNGGFMGCLDVYDFLISQENNPLEGKKVVFIEIMNGGSSYTNHIIDSLEQDLDIDENEYSTLKADFQAGLNLDKVPDYLSGVVYNMSVRDTNIEYVPIFLPHRTSLDELEGRLGGELEEPEKAKVDAELNQRNQVINDLLGDNPDFSEPWEYTEPPLSRHLSSTNVSYGEKMLTHPEVQQKLNAIRDFCKAP